MKTAIESIQRRTTGDTDILDLTRDVARIVSGTGVQQGVATVFVPGSTGGITTIEFESGVVEDLKKAIDRMAPRDMDYAHDARWGDGNGYSHVRAAMIGPSLAVPIREGSLTLGTWQQIVLCDFDNRPRNREILIQVVGE